MGSKVGKIDPERVYTLAQAAARCPSTRAAHAHTRTLREWIAEGRLKASKFGSKRTWHYLVRGSDLLAALGFGEPSPTPVHAGPTPARVQRARERAERLADAAGL